jgi:hypothetical protein
VIYISQTDFFTIQGIPNKFVTPKKISGASSSSTSFTSPFKETKDSSINDQIDTAMIFSLEDINPPNNGKIEEEEGEEEDQNKEEGKGEKGEEGDEEGEEEGEKEGEQEEEEGEGEEEEGEEKIKEVKKGEEEGEEGDEEGEENKEDNKSIQLTWTSTTKQGQEIIKECFDGNFFKKLPKMKEDFAGWFQNDLTRNSIPHIALAITSAMGLKTITKVVNPTAGGASEFVVLSALMSDINIKFYTSDLQASGTSNENKKVMENFLNFSLNNLTCESASKDAKELDMTQNENKYLIWSTCIGGPDLWLPLYLNALKDKNCCGIGGFKTMLGLVITPEDLSYIDAFIPFTVKIRNSNEQHLCQMVLFKDLEFRNEIIENTQKVFIKYKRYFFESPEKRNSRNSNK